jgi:hypothetical protein
MLYFNTLFLTYQTDQAMHQALQMVFKIEGPIFLTNTKVLIY